MKLILLAACLMALTGCLEKNESSSNPNPDPYRTCGGRQQASSKSTMCLARTDYTIISHKSLPAKIKISIISEGRTFEYFNECKVSREVEIERNVDSGKINFVETRGMFYKGIELEIVNMGDACDNDAIFFSGMIVPTIIVVPDFRDKAIIDLEN